MKMTPGNQTRTTILTASKVGARLFRINTGLAWVGDIVEKTRERMVILNPRPFKAGVVGMSDTAGFVPTLITPEMVGTTIARFVAVEDKQGTGRPSEEQKSYIKMVRQFGGYAGISRSEPDTIAIINGEIRD